VLRGFHATFRLFGGAIAHFALCVFERGNRLPPKPCPMSPTTSC
jgi:hypothetical protein